MEFSRETRDHRILRYRAFCDIFVEATLVVALFWAGTRPAPTSFSRKRESTVAGSTIAESRGPGGSTARVTINRGIC
jgi:hypothetical protein